jgi:hypothetical protein
MKSKATPNVIDKYRKAYLKATKKEKSRLLSIITETTGYDRKYAIKLLKTKPRKKPPIKRKRRSRYAHLLSVLSKIWTGLNFICGRRLQSFLPDVLPNLERHNEVSLSNDDRQLLLAMSISTINRLLKSERAKLQLKGRSSTKPGTLLKHQIPIRTFADWNEATPGFMEIDLVAHCGGSLKGEYLHTLSMTDICTQWMALPCFMGRSDRFCSAAISEATSSLPFPLLGIDSDNDSCFINEHLLRFYERNSLTFTRGRASKPNDSCHIEQKNWDVVRRNIGYARFDKPEHLPLLRSALTLLSLYQNFFQPSSKLIDKHRNGARYKKTYDKPQTPCQRLLLRPDIPQKTKDHLQQTFDDLNPFELITNIRRLVDEMNRL